MLTLHNVKNVLVFRHRKRELGAHFVWRREPATRTLPNSSAFINIRLAEYAVCCHCRSWPRVFRCFGWNMQLESTCVAEDSNAVSRRKEFANHLVRPDLFRTIRARISRAINNEFVRVLCCAWFGRMKRSASFFCVRLMYLCQRGFENKRVCVNLSDVGHVLSIMLLFVICIVWKCLV